MSVLKRKTLTYLTFNTYFIEISLEIYEDLGKFGA